MTATPGIENGNDTLSGILTIPTVSYLTGFYDQDSLTINIFSEDNDATIYYTVDGTLPTTYSNIYSQPIVVDSNTVFRVRSFKNGWMQSPINTQTYILENDQHDFPTIFLTSDPDNFFDYDSGIYVMGPNASNEYPYLTANILNILFLIINSLTFFINRLNVSE